MKLGNLVKFSSYYIKSGENFSKEYATEEEMENGVTINRWAKVTDGKIREGIVVGKRRYASGYRFDYIQNDFYENGEWSWHPTPLGKESFYLVATNLNAMFKVKAEDLELSFHEDPIEGLIDE